MANDRGTSTGPREILGARCLSYPLVTKAWLEGNQPGVRLIFQLINPTIVAVNRF